MATPPSSIGSYIQPSLAKPPAPKPAPNPLAGILTNPGVVLAGMNRDQTLGNANALLRQGRSQALINYGDPGLARSLGVAVDPNTAAAAQANQFSTTANLAHQNQIAGRNLLNNLAGRGLIHSGELGYQQGEQARSYGQASYNDAQNLLASLNQQLQGYTSTTQGAQNAYLNALLGAFGTYGTNPLGVAGG
jgi:hypothetical protein